MQKMQLPPDCNAPSIKHLVDKRRLLIVDFELLAGVEAPTSAGYYCSSDTTTRNIFYAPYVLMYTQR